MPRRTIDSLVEMLDALRSTGVTAESKLSMPALEMMVMRKIGSDPRTIENAKLLLAKFQLLKPTDDPELFKIDFERAAELSL
jgi:hypothetical protein